MSYRSDNSMRYYDDEYDASSNERTDPFIDTSTVPSEHFEPDTGYKGSSAPRYNDDYYNHPRYSDAEPDRYEGDYVRRDYHRHDHYRDDEYRFDDHRSDGYHWDDADSDSLSGDRVEPLFQDTVNSGPVDGITLSHDDLNDVAKDTPNPFFRKALWRIAAAIVFFGVGLMILQSVTPSVTAYDIVSMDDYEGQQKPSWTLDPSDMEGCDSTSACFKEKLAVLSSTNQEPQVLKEIPASTSAVPTQNVHGLAQTPSNLEIMFVKEQWSNMRKAPNIGSEIITAISAGREVEIISQSGRWFEVVTTDQRSLRGYMHSSTLQQ